MRPCQVKSTIDPCFGGDQSVHKVGQTKTGSQRRRGARGCRLEEEKRREECWGVPCILERPRRHSWPLKSQPCWPQRVQEKHGPAQEMPHEPASLRRCCVVCRLLRFEGFDQKSFLQTEFKLYMECKLKSDKTGHETLRKRSTSRNLFGFRPIRFCRRRSRPHSRARRIRPTALHLHLFTLLTLVFLPTRCSRRPHIKGPGQPWGRE